MNVLHVSGASSWGGNEQQFTYLLDELPKHGVKQFLFCYRDSPVHQAAKNHPVSIIDIPKIKPHKKAYQQALNKAVIENEIDVIHLHTSNAVTGYVLADIFYSLDTPTVFARKSVRKRNSFPSILKYNYKNIHKVISISQYVERHFKRVLWKRNHHKFNIVYNGVRPEEMNRKAPFQLREKLQLKPETFLIGNIANHTKAKDLKTLIRTIDELVHKHQVTDIHVVQIGEFTKRTDAIQKEIAKYKLGDYVTLMGFVEKASAFLPQFDLFIMTSEREGGPSSIVESFFHKTPVISTRVGVVDEVIEDGINGFSAEVGDYKSLAEKIKKFKETPELHAQFPERSHEIFQKKFTAEQLGRNTFRVYQDLLKEKAKSQKV